jgi:NAD(P)-dependent dehydrogenase (short-subunit alcohol dehydrogenase family)
MSELVLAGKVALVTGGARGLGRAYALRLARLGADVAIADIDLDAWKRFDEKIDAPSVAAEIEALGRRAIMIESDLSADGAPEALVAETLAKLGRVDILINNAGGMVTSADSSTASTTSAADMERLFAVNFGTMAGCCRAAVPAMRANGGGVVINVSSSVGHEVFDDGRLAGYAAAKAAVLHFTKYLAVEAGPWGIRVNAIAPGVIMTSRIASTAAQRGIGTPEQLAKVPLQRFGDTEDCAGVIEFLATDLSRYVTGVCINIDGGSTLV